MNKDLLTSLVSGGVAGVVVDVSLFPLDTIKTRLQSSQGFLASGGFRGVYKGLLSVAVGSFPSAAAFFCAYELSKKKLEKHITNPSVVYMMSATLGEVVGCSVRVPSEVIKQRAQANKHLTSTTSFLFTIRSEGIPGLYRGYFKMILREVPFSFIQFPIWEFIKKELTSKDKSFTSLKSAIAGGVSGSIAGILTTPIDVVKTRVMLAESESYVARAGILEMLLKIGREEGVAKLFSGVVPRVVWLGLGGFVFFGAYEKCKFTIIDWT